MAQEDSAGPVLSLLLGLGLGARHAFEPDHLAAISMLTSQAPGLRRGALLGMLWGLGHSAALLAVGLALALLSAHMPSGIADALELAVACVLVSLGSRAIAQALRAPRVGAPHRHGPLDHPHRGVRDHVHLRRWVLSRPLLFGMLHGLAGSGALTALAIATLPTLAGRLGFIALFGLGSVVAMASISGLWGWPLARLASRPQAVRWLTASAGLFSAALGLSWGLAAMTRLLA